MSEKVVIVIPARMASSRFPNKPMTVIKGKTMIERVWRIGKAVRGAHEVIIATEDQQLKIFAEAFGAKVVITSPSCLTGTDRVAEISHLEGVKYGIFFNLQGDAVLTPPWVIEGVLEAIIADSTIGIGTPAVHLTGAALTDFIASKNKGSSSGTTVVFNKKGEALYFSKALIPFHRNEHTLDRLVYRHIGLYAYRLETLQQLGQLTQGYLEQSEKLEQLRALEHGIPIRVIPVDYRGRTHGSVDQPEDVAIVEEVIEREGELL